MWSNEYDEIVKDDKRRKAISDKIEGDKKK